MDISTPCIQDIVQNGPRLLRNNKLENLFPRLSCCLSFFFFFLIRNSKGSFPLTSYPVHFFGKQSVTSRDKLAKPQSPSQICFASTAANKLLPCFPCCVASLEMEEIFLSSPNEKLCFRHKCFALFSFFLSLLGTISAIKGITFVVMSPIQTA